MEAPKPAGRFRVLALGDSFAYGMVPYPDNVLTSVEKQLSESCRDLDVEILNFGILATKPADYQILLDFVSADGVEMMMVLFPSQWQVYGPRREALIETLSRRKDR